ncbi:MAG: Lrp/AsnC family transcriptional regulator [Gammaproteobacteria bacterium]|nr:Lrp/AsnC family transcriptional regulator [Gammaproteobacteria bacterium]
MKTQNQTYSICGSSSGPHFPELSNIEKQLLNNFQHDFPGTSTPYASIAQELGVTEQDVLDVLQKLKKMGTVSRIGAVFEPQRIGTSTLATMAVPAAQLQEVAHLVSSYVSVNHNYERTHHYNLWFVVTAPDDEQLESVLRDIEQESGFPVLSLPMLESYHIDLGFELGLDQKK